MFRKVVDGVVKLIVCDDLAVTANDKETFDV